MSKEPPRPIYAVLGARPDVSLTLARELYWRRVGGLRTASLDADELDEAFGELNLALEIVMNQRRRAEYDAAHGLARRVLDSTTARSGALAFRSTLATTAGALAGGQLQGVAALGIAMTTWSVAMAGALALSRRDAPPDALGPLRLSDDATLEDLEIAYRTLADELLSRLGADPGIVRHLDRLDQIYVRAATALAERWGTDAEGGPAASRLAFAAAHHEATLESRRDASCPQLQLTQPPGAAVPVADRPRVLGRHPGCDVVLAGVDVAPQHAVIWVTGGAAMLHVLEPGVTANVNGRPMRWAILEDGDLIEIGMSQIRVTVPRAVNVRQGPDTNASRMRSRRFHTPP